MNNATRNSAIYVVGGGKGGVGKSLSSHALVDCLRTPILDPAATPSPEPNEVCYIESDDSNPDVYKAIHDSAGVHAEVCNLDNEDGYVRLINTIGARTDLPVVINTAARATATLIEHGGLLAAAAQEQGRELVMLWVINRQRDSLELLRQWLDSKQAYSAVYVVRNLYFGAAEKFDRYNNGRLKTEITGTIDLPEVTAELADYLTDHRLCFWSERDRDGKAFSLGYRLALNSWRARNRKAFAQVL